MSVSKAKTMRLIIALKCHPVLSLLRISNQSIMNSFRTLIISLALPSLLVLGCTKKSDNNEPVSSVPVGKARDLGAASESFGMRLLGRMAASNPNENTLISPWSIQSALLMAANGGNGLTQSQTLDALGLSSFSMDSINKMNLWLQNGLLAAQGANLNSVNAVFVDPQRMAVKASFESHLNQYFNASFHNEVFSDPNAKTRINQWVKQNTQNKIDKIIEGINPDDLAFLINALYFKANWERGLPAEMIQTRDFSNADGTQKPVTFVFDDYEYQFNQSPDWSLVEIPFEDGEFVMTIMMPTQNGNLINALQQLDSVGYHQLINNAQKGRIILGFPKMELDFSDDIIPSLKALGMLVPFDAGSADFSEMGQSLIGPGIYISQVRHAAVLKIDEKGAEGAAVTSVGMATTSMPPSFVFDKPFVLFIRHKATDTQLFAAYVSKF